MTDQPTKQEDTKNTSENTNSGWRPSRRQFLIGMGATLAVGIAAGAPILTREARLAVNQTFQTGSAPTEAPPESPLIWFEIAPDNRATVYIPKVEMGQGVHTGLAQIAADELELDWETVTVKQANISQGFGAGLIFTFGSATTTSLFNPIREIAATMRDMLRTEAANQFDVATDEIVLENSYAYRRDDRTQRISYGDIVATKQREWVIPEEAPTLKDASEWRYIGKSMGRVDFQEKVTGRAVYGYDARMDGMGYGAVARPPRYGATLVRAEAGEAETMLGVIAVVIEDGFAGVVARSRKQARDAVAAMILEWEGGTSITQDELEAYIRVPDDGAKAILVQREGGGGVPNGRQFQRAYWTPMAAHAHLEPQGAVVSVDDENVIALVPTQHPGTTQNALADALGIPSDNIDIKVTYLGGSFGRKLGADVGSEAARLSRGAGIPVHVGWTREEDMQYGFHRPPSHNVLTAVLDEDNKMIALEHEIAGGDIFFGNGTVPSFVGNILGNDPMSTIGSNIYYNIGHRRVFAYRRPLDIPTGFWRGLGSFPNLFAQETFFDELALDLEQDALDFRLNYLPEGELGTRFRNVMEEVTQAANWGNAPADSGQGLAVCFDRGTVAALIFQVSGDIDNISIDRAWCAVDAGFIVNPDGAASQIQGQIVMGLSSAMYEKLELGEGMVQTANFNTYPLIRMSDTPEIDVLFVNSADEPTGGIGEPVIGIVPAALSNAIFALTGERKREMPFFR